MISLEKGLTRRSRLIWQVLLLVVFMLLWELAADRLISVTLVSRPSQIYDRLVLWVENGTLVTSLWATFRVVIIGFVVGSLAGLVLGYLFGWYRAIGDILQPAMTALYSLPRLALAPLFLLWFGFGSEFRISFSATLVLFFVYYNTFFGVREVPPELLNSVRVMGGSRRDLAVKVVIPSAMTWVAAGLKISVPYALVGVVVAEMLAANEGLGFLVMSGANQFQPSTTFAAILILMVIALLLDAVLALFLKRALRWKNTDGEASPGRGLRNR